MTKKVEGKNKKTHIISDNKKDLKSKKEDKKSNKN
jgi:hypothetical protein